MCLPGVDLNTDIEANKDVPIVDATRVDEMRLQILLQQGLTAIITNIVISCITAVILYPAVSHQFVFSWIGLSLLVNLSRLQFRHFAIKQLSSNSSHEELVRYENTYAAGLFISGSIWGSLAWVLSPDLPVMQQLAIPLVIAGMSAGAIFSYLSSIRSFCAFVLPMILPINISLYLAGFNAIGLTTLIYLVVVIVLARNLTQRLMESLRLREENQTLVRHLSEVNQAQFELVQSLQAKETFLTHTFEDAGVPMLLMKKSFVILDVNKAGCRLFDYDKDSLKGKRAVQLLHPDDASNISPQFQKLLRGEINQYQIIRRCISSQGKTLWLNATLSAVRNDAGEIEYVVIQAQDITEQYMLSQDLHHQTLHDALTGLPNRRALEKQLKHVLKHETSRQHVFAYLDLDQFKVINDTCGHIAGDALLKQISSLLRDKLRKNDLLARFSGDEFAILMTDCSLDTAIGIMEKVLEYIRAMSFEYEDSTFKISASIGLVTIDSDSTEVELLKQADSACYAAKEAGRDRLHISSDSDTELAQRRGEMRWVARIQQALDNDRLVLFSQVITATQSRKARVPHCELLIRMLDEDGSIIPPVEFLPAAERYNLIAAIDMWVVEQVVLKLTEARDKSRDISGIYAINLSGQSLGDARFYEHIIRLIAEARLDKANAVICFEVTETAAITNMRSALNFIQQLRQIGCLFALDDFGSGLSSFAYLKQLPIDYLKIDGMFVKDCIHNSVNHEIVNSINGIGQALGLKTVAEFVEDEATHITMQHIGVDFVQGYLLGKPEPWQV